MKTKAPIILASKSKARSEMLKSAGLNFETMPADIDESKIAGTMGEEGYYAPGIALEIAKQKALKISEQNPDALVIGSDQTLEFEEQFILKSKTPKEAKEKLKILRGEKHTLVSAVCVARAGKILWSFIDEAYLTMHALEDEEIDHYCMRAGGALLDAVGGYELEGLGSWLFSSVKGDYFTVLGMPLLPLLSYLRREHEVIP